MEDMISNTPVLSAMAKATPRAGTRTARIIVARITVKACSLARSSSWLVSKTPMASARPTAAIAALLFRPANCAAT